MKDERAPNLYHSVQAEDNDDSSTDVETLDLNEKDYMQQGSARPKRTGFLATLKHHRWLLDTFLLVIILFLLLEKSFSHHGKNHHYEGNGDITGFAPEFSQQIKTFSPDPIFVPENTSEFFSNETREAWLGLVPKGLGYLKIKNPDDFDNLPKKLKSYPRSYVLTSGVTHQLHCLYAIAEAYSGLTSDADRVPSETPWHLNHCFDYLRQSIMCCGDVALEGEQTSFPPGFDGSDGWDAKHVCKNYDQVYDYLEKNRVESRRWI